MAIVTVTDTQKLQADSAREELTDMLLDGVTSPTQGDITAPFLGLEGAPSAALDLYEVVHLAVMRLLTFFSAFSNTTASYPHTSGSFTTKGGTLLVFFSGTALPSAPGMFGMDIKVDASTVGTVEIHGTSATDHKMLSRVFLVSNIAAGSHTLGAALRSNTTTDANDRISAFVVELPL